MYVCSSKTKIILIGIRGWHFKQMAGKTSEYGSNMEQIDEQFGSWWTHIISWPCIFGMYSTWMQTEWNYCWTVYKDVWITYFCWSKWKLLGWGKKRNEETVAWSYDMEGHAPKMRWAIAGKQKWSSFAKYRIGNACSLIENKGNRHQCGWYQNGWKDAEDGSHVDEIDEERWSWRTHIISWPCVFGMHSTWM